MIGRCPHFLVIVRACVLFFLIRQKGENLVSVLQNLSAHERVLAFLCRSVCSLFSIDRTSFQERTSKTPDGVMLKLYEKVMSYYAGQVM